MAPNENLSIKEMTEIALSKLEKNINVCYNGTLDGQFRKDGSNKKLLELCFLHFFAFLYNTN